MVAIAKHIKVPELRFPEFSGEWVEKRLGEVCDKPQYGLNSAAIPFNGIDAYIRITDINQESGEFKTDSMVSPDSIDHDSCLVEVNDILIARTGASTGKSFIYRRPFDCKLHFAGFLIRFKVKTDVPFFIYSKLQSTTYHRWVSIMSMRSGQPGINASEYSSFSFYIPSLPEQQKIADFLTAVDAKIGKLKRKKELLEAYKKGAMQKLFSQEIRFKDDQGYPYPDWEEKRLGDVIEKQSSSLALGDLEGNEGHYLVYGASGEIGTFNSYQQDDEFIGIVKDGAGVGRLIRCGGQSSVLGTLDILKNSGDSVLNFIFQLLQTVKFHRYITGSTIPHIYFSDYRTLKKEIPSLPEQQKIAEFLTGIDGKITAVANQIDKAAEFKKGLLQKMFV